MELWLLLSGLLIFIFVLDDLFIDAYSLVMNLRPKRLPIGFESRRSNEVLGIMVANWKESEVLEAMVKTNSRLLADPNVFIFLGVYPNDTETAEIAFRLANSNDRVIVVVNRENGPTFKGQMINEIIRSMLTFEYNAGIKFKGFIIHDSEDVIHPYSMDLYRFGLKTADFIQLPVLSLPRSPEAMVGGIYLDEFAEAHSKDMLVRQKMGVAIPSAGVGTCLSRKLVLEFCKRNQGNLFAKKDLTEDYILGHEAKKLGFKASFLSYLSTESYPDIVSTREFFPNSFMASIKQKTRWTLGISIQGWKQLGWFGSLPQMYFLWRDRKALFSAFLNINCLAVLGYMIGIGIDRLENPILLSWLLTFNLLFMVTRLLIRMRWTYNFYGFTSALLVPLRWPIGMLINSFAGLRALYQHYRSLLTSVELKWEKTQHEFPDAIHVDLPVIAEVKKEISV